MQLHQVRFLHADPSNVISALAMLETGVLACGRRNGSIEIWRRGLNWHLDVCISGAANGDSVSTLAWSKGDTPRLFSAGLHGVVTEWDLQLLKPKVL